MKLNAFGLDRISVFHAVYQHLSMKTAAEKLHLTVSAVSQSLTKLEEGLDTQLFIRSGKILLPTEKANALFERTSQFSLEVRELFYSSAQTKELTGMIRIGAPPIFGQGPLFDAVDSFRQSHPKVVVSMSLLSSGRVFEDIRSNRLEFGFIDQFPEAIAAKDVACEAIAKEELILCGRRDIVPIALSKSVAKLSDLMPLPHVPYHSGSEGMRKWYLYHFKKVPEFRTVFSIDHVLGVVKAITRGWGVGVVPRHSVEEGIQKGTIHQILGPKGPFINDILVTQLKGRTPDLLQRKFLAHVRKCFRKQI
jgi:DNA-binding transcriptional LysR family regulator